MVRDTSNPEQDASATLTLNVTPGGKRVSSRYEAALVFSNNPKQIRKASDKHVDERIRRGLDKVVLGSN